MLGWVSSQENDDIWGSVASKVRDAPNIRSPKIWGRKTFITETIRPKCCDDANRNRDLHVLVWSNMSAVWTYFCISEKDPRTAVYKTCHAERNRLYCDKAEKLLFIKKNLPLYLKT